MSLSDTIDLCHTYNPGCAAVKKVTSTRCCRIMDNPKHRVELCRYLSKRGMKNSRKDN